MKLSFTPMPLVIFALILTVTTGVLAYDKLNLLPTKAIYELVVIVVSLLSMLKFRKLTFYFSFVSLVYIIVSYVGTLYSFGQVNNVDFFIAYKSFFYIILLSPLVGKSYLSYSCFNYFFCFLIFCFLIKYILSRFVFGNPRPGLLDENNFELLFLLMMFLLSYSSEGKVSFWKLFLVGLIVLISGSRSGILSLLFVVFMMYDKKLTLKGVLAFLVFVVLAAISGFVLMQRLGGGLESIDRFLFLQLFINEVSDWNLMRYLFGNFALTPLSFYTCHNLSFFQTLFSHQDNGTCYSVILHSYILRMIFDHGVLGLVFILTFTYRTLVASGYNLKFCIAVIGLICINGLSVSAFNSVFCFLGLLFMLVTSDRFNYERCYDKASNLRQTR
ncbi:O-antigen ligase family protein [Vibrio alginolyticus]|nr:O-antigen ligase family protein [Vibrio alginolyticus]